MAHLSAVFGGGAPRRPAWAGSDAENAGRAAINKRSCAVFIAAIVTILDALATIMGEPSSQIHHGGTETRTELSHRVIAPSDHRFIRTAFDFADHPITGLPDHTISSAPPR